MKPQVHLRYSKALFNLAKTKQEKEKQLQELQLFQDLLENAPKAKSFFSSAQITKSEKEDVLKAALKDKLSANVLKSLLLLLKKGRFNHLNEIVDEYRKKVNDLLQVIDARLITPAPVGNKILETLKTKLEKKYGKKIILTEENDPKLVGGGILFVDNQMVDFSVKGKLERLKDNLLSVNI